MEFNFDVTAKGSPIVEFKDHYDIECTIQQCTIGSRDAIWVGVSERKSQIPRYYEGKIRIPFDTEIDQASDAKRMYLTKKEVKQLLPVLKHFAKYGNLPYEETDLEKRDKE
jgi:hypothetical protein